MKIWRSGVPQVTMPRSKMLPLVLVLSISLPVYSMAAEVWLRCETVYTRQGTQVDLVSVPHSCALRTINENKTNTYWYVFDPQAKELLTYSPQSQLLAKVGSATVSDDKITIFQDQLSNSNILSSSSTEIDRRTSTYTYSSVYMASIDMNSWAAREGCASGTYTVNTKDTGPCHIIQPMPFRHNQF